MAQDDSLRPGSREPLVDGLRVLALAGVLVVNATGYASGPYGPLLGLPQPADSLLAQVAYAGVAMLFQAKAYPLLAFLFGYSFALSIRARSVSALPHRRGRMLRLLALGVAHGLLLYSGDILTAYAVCGLVLLHWARLPVAALLSRLRWLLLLCAASVLASLVLSQGVVPGLALVELLPNYAGVTGWGQWLSLNVDAYLNAVLWTPIVFLPELLTITLAGFVAGRLRWLTHRRWQAARGRLAGGLPWALAANAVYALVLDAAVQRGLAAQGAVVCLSLLTGPWLAAALTAAIAARWHEGGARWVAMLAPAGRYTLSIYVGWSLLLGLAFSGVGLAWQPGTAAVVLLALAAWFVCVAAGRRAARAGRVGPLERWLAGRRLQRMKG